jgi:hypothetical protein
MLNPRLLQEVGDLNLYLYRIFSARSNDRVLEIDRSHIILI